MVSKLILFPLAIMFFMSVLGGFMNLSSWTTSGRVDANGNLGNSEGWVDDTGYMVCFNNFTFCGGVNVTDSYIMKSPGGVVNLVNSTGIYDLVSFKEQESLGGDSAGIIPDFAYDVLTGNGGIEVYLAIMVIALVVGLRVLGNGVNGFSVSFIVFGLGFAALWFLVSAGGYPMMSQLPFFGGIAYFGLSVMYAVGMFGLSSSSGGD